MTPTHLPAGMPRAVTDDDTILATAEIPQPVEHVFRALTTKEVENWWGSPETYQIINWTADLRVGGRWSLGVRLPNGTVYPASGEFIEIESPKKIVQTRKYDWDHPNLGRRVTTVTYRLEPIPNGTRITVRHEGLQGLRDAADEHASGWERFLGWLDTYFRSGAPPPGEERQMEEKSHE